ncbi:MAG: bifunctional riboflavin kinase/FAD synthetase [Fimbriimonadales bacterium]|nr:bifunctional riboflavin kinase/FAD synthetase [Fimbriimonadales bacterium]
MSWVVGVEGLQNAFPGGCALTMGVFDGVHRGHSALITATVDWAHRHSVPAVALTFHPHPTAVLAPQHTPQMLCTLAHRIERLLRQGIDLVVVQPFTSDFARLSAQEFLSQILQEGLHCRAVVVGDDFRFGQRRSGSVETLRQVTGLEVITVEGILDESGARISSTRIRELVQTGNLERANALLGEPLHWTGVAVRGDGRGRALGYPTANLVPIEPLITPPEGVYACVARIRSHAPSPLTFAVEESETYPAAVSVGKPPMFENARGRVEAYLVDFPDEDLYGRVITLQFLEHLRPQEQFESVDALLRQMARDVARARQIVQEVQSRR